MLSSPAPVIRTVWGASADQHLAAESVASAT
jgi:hypothetical protein